MNAGLKKPIFWRQIHSRLRALKIQVIISFGKTKIFENDVLYSASGGLFWIVKPPNSLQFNFISGRTVISANWEWRYSGPEHKGCMIWTIYSISLDLSFSSCIIGIKKEQSDKKPLILNNLNMLRNQNDFKDIFSSCLSKKHIKMQMTSQNSEKLLEVFKKKT